jgi:hypothetical protein
MGQAAGICGFVHALHLDSNLLVVVFVAGDAVADAVLLAVDVSLLRLGQMAVVLGHVGLFPLLDRGFTPFCAASFGFREPLLMPLAMRCCCLPSRRFTWFTRGWPGSTKPGPAPEVVVLVVV